MQQVESVLGWSHTRHLLVKWAQSVSRKAQHGLWCSMFQQGMDPFEPSPALRLTSQLSSPWDFWPYLPTQKINFLTCLWSFTLRPLTLWIKGGTVDVRENFHFTGWDPWSSVALPETEPLLSLPEPQDCRHWLCGWIAPLSPLRLFTCMTYSPNCLQDLSQNAKLISCLGFATVSSSYRHHMFPEKRVKCLRKANVTATTT